MKQTTLYKAIVLTLACLGQSYTFADSINYTYGKNGLPQSQSNALGQTENYTYDSLGRVIIYEAPKNQTTDTQGPLTRFTYHIDDQLTQINDPKGLNTDYQYNDFGELIKLQSPDTGIEINNYTFVSNLKNRTDANSNQTHLIYDNNHQVNRLVKADSIITLKYGTAGGAIDQLISATDTLSKATLVWDYNPFGEIIKKTQQTCCGTTLTVEYGYDQAGRLTSITYPSGQILHINYDEQLKTVGGLNYSDQPVVSDVQLTPLGQLKSLKLGNDIIHNRSFDNRGRLQSYTLNNQIYTLAYDEIDRITGISSLNGTQQYNYDNQNRLTHYQYGTETESYQYDANHNRTQLTKNGITQALNIDSNSNRLANVSYDANGNLIQDNQHNYTYSSSNQLVKVQADSLTTEYTYNALGQRITKKNANEETYFIYNEAGQLLGEYDKTGKAITEYLWLADIPIATVSFDKHNHPIIHYVETDQLHTPRLVTDESKNTVWQWLADPFGQQSPTGSLTYNFRFPGQYFDKESNLHYNYYRDYDPSTARYIQSDPIGLEAGINTYAYVSANPIMYFDSEGLQLGGINQFVQCVGIENAALQANGTILQDKLNTQYRLASQCPKSPNSLINDPNWVSYAEKGNSKWFHCGYDAYIEKRQPTPQAPGGECVYDEKGRLVDENHKYPGCRGTPNEYGTNGFKQKMKHTIFDKGGIVKAGLPAFIDTRRKAIGVKASKKDRDYLYIGPIKK